MLRPHVRSSRHPDVAAAATGTEVGGWEDASVKINHQVVVFDTADLTAESSFWAGVLGGTIDAEDDWHHGVGRRRAPGGRSARA